MKMTVTLNSVVKLPDTPDGAERERTISVVADFFVTVEVWTVEEGIAQQSDYSFLKFSQDDVRDPEKLSKTYAGERVDVFKEIVTLCGKAYNAYIALQDLKD